MPDAPIEVNECGVLYSVDVLNGHKTGFYVDQRDSRDLLSQLAKDKEVLNMFCYTGGFSLAALKGGAKHVTSVDSSGEALAMAQKQMALKKLFWMPLRSAMRIHWMVTSSQKSWRNCNRKST